MEAPRVVEPVRIREAPVIVEPVVERVVRPPPPIVEEVVFVPPPPPVIIEYPTEVKPIEVKKAETKEFPIEIPQINYVSIQ